MANEFEFLRSRWPKLAALGADAARLVDFSPVTALSSLRDYCEWAADITLDVLGNPMAPDTPQLERLSALKAMGSVPPDILQKFHNIRATEDRVSGNPLGDPNEARARMADAVDIGRWLMRQDGGVRSGYTGRQTPVRGGYGSGDDTYATGRRTPVRREPSQNTGSYHTSSYNPGAYASGNTGSYNTSSYQRPPQDEAPYDDGQGGYPEDGYDNGGYADDGYQDGYDNGQDGYEPPRRGRGGYNGGSSGGGGRFDLSRYKRFLTMPVIISAVLVIVLLVALILILSRCGGRTAPDPQGTTPSATAPSETLSILVTPTPSPTATPNAPANNAQIKYLDEFAEGDITKSHTAWENYYLGKWTANSHNASFSIFNGGSGSDAKGILYEHGLGWFIKSSDFDSNEARRALTFNTNGQYSALTFDMGVDKEWLFDDAKDCGTYQLMVFVDDKEDPVWTSEEVNYNYYKTGISVDVTGAQKVKIRLIEKKGSKGSLNVVLGNAGFVPAAGGTSETTPAGGETTTPATGETTAAETTTTAPAAE